MQKLAEICVRRPVFATMIILALTVIGAFSFFTLGVDRFPNVDFPIVTVTTANPGASPEEIERDISDVIEGSVNTISGIDDLRSTSMEGVSVVVITFTLEKDVDVAAQEVRQNVDLVLRDLPETAEPPVVQKVDADAAPILQYAISSSQPLVELTELVDKRIVERLESIGGVGNIDIFGGRAREVQIRLDVNRLRAFNLAVMDVVNALRAQNIELPAGSIDQGARAITVRTLGRVGRIEDFDDIIIQTRNGYAIKVGDVAEVRSGGAQPESAAALDGRPAVVVSIQKQSGTNTVEVARNVRERMAELLPVLPRDLEVRLIRDQSEFIDAALHAIQEHLVLGGLFASIVVFVFLWNFRSTVIAAVAIPTSIVAAFGVMWALGYTLNQMTMLALTLMVGIVIDDAIVVLENIYRFVEEKGMQPFQAAIEGTREIGLAVMATTLSLLAVFMPIGFMGGIVGRFMASFGLTSSAAIAMSLLVSFTLTPMLAARWIKRRSEEPPEEAPEEAVENAVPEHSGSKDSRFYQVIDRRYTAMLVWSMAHRRTIVALCGLAIVSIVPLFMMAGINFLPQEDESQFEISVRAPEGTSLAALQSILERMGRDIRQTLPAIENTLTIAGGSLQSSNSGSVFVRLTPIGERDQSQQKLMVQAREMMKRYSKEIVTSVQPVAAITGGGNRSTAIQFILAGPDLDKLDKYSARLLEHMKGDPNIVDADRSLVQGKPELRVNIDRKRAADLGVRVTDIATTLNVMLAGTEVSTFTQASNRYDIRVRAQEQFRRRPDELMEMSVPSAEGTPVRLRSFVQLEEGTGPSSIDRLNRERQVTLTANVAPDGSQAKAIQSMQQFVAGMGMEPGYRQALTGQSKELQRAGLYFGLAFLLSFIFMYMVLAAQFESFIHPVTILLTLPLAIPFALLSTFVAGQQLNIFSMLGILLLFGVVKKNAILQIDHTIELRAQGMDRYEAIITANRHRLRPILMTTIALVAGMTPLILSSGPGAATNRSIGVLVAGGQALCLLLTLLAVPVFYSLFEDLSRHPAWARVGSRFAGISERGRRRLIQAGAFVRGGFPRRHKEPGYEN